MTTNLIRGKSRKGFVVVASVVVLLLLIASAVVTVTNVARQQDRDGLLQLKNEQLGTLVDAKSKLPSAVNAYIEAYKKAHTAAGSRVKAEQDSKNEHDAFKQAEASARDAMASLKAGRGATEGELSDAIAQYEDSYLGFVDYMAGLVDSYPQFHALFGDSDESCQGIFIGSRATNMSERKNLLTEAAGICRSATEKLGQSKNSTYIDYARRVENRVSKLEVDSTATAQAAQNVQAFTSELNQLSQKADEALNRNVSEDELSRIHDEIRNLNSRIKVNRSELDYAGERYLKTVKEMPALLEDVFSKHVSAETKYYDSVNPIRAKVLEAVIDDALVE
jgi:hypothetical protein